MRVDFADADGVKLDVSPLSGSDVLGFNYSAALDRTGAFALSVAANSEHATAVQTARQIWAHNDGEGYVFKGVIEEVQERVDVDGTAILQVNGRSLAARLAWKTTLLGRTFDNQPLASVVSTLLTGSGFTAGEIAAPLTNISTRFDGRSLWDALRFVAEVFGLSLREDNLAGEVDIAEFGEPCGIVLKNLPSLSPNQASNLNIVSIRSIQRHTYALDIVNRVIPIAQQSGIAGSTVWFNLADSTRVSPYTIGSAVGPDGFTYYYIEDAASIARYGVREKVVQVKDILPLGVSATDFERAANTLYDEAVTYLQRHKEEQAQYDVDAVGLTHVAVSPRFDVGDTLRVQYSGTTEDVDGTRATLTVDADLYLMGFSRTFDASGADTWKLTLSTILREIPDDGNRTAAFLRELEAVKAAPLPYVLFGDNVVRISPEGMQFVAADSGDALMSPPIATRIKWLRESFNGAEIADVVGGYATPGASLTHILWMRAFLSSAAESSTETSMGVYEDAVNDWVHRLSVNDLTTNGARPMYLARELDEGLFAVEKVDTDNYRLLVRKAGSLVEVAGSMKTANTGQFLIPPGPSVGNWVSSGSANAYGAWKPLPVGSAVAPAAPTETSNNGSANVLMPPTIAAGDLLVAFITRAFGGSLSTPGGWTLLGSGTNTVLLGVYYKVADGTEDGTNVSFGSTTGCAQVYRILAANYVGVPTISTVSTGLSPNPDPTAVVPPAGQFLALAACCAEGDSPNAVTSGPSGYSGFDARTAGVGSDTAGACMGSAYLIDSGTSENPGSFATVSNRVWVAFAVAIAADNATLEAAYITDLAIEISGTPSYAQVQLGTGNAGAEVAIGTYKLTPSDWTLQCGAVVPVAISTRLSARMATSASPADHFLTLGMLNQDDTA